MDKKVLRILLVEDEPPLQRMLVRYLEGLQASVVVTSDASSALDFISRQEFDVVVTDVGLPGRSGIDLLVQVKNEWPALPVVLMTGSGDVATAVDALHGGADRYLVKPFALDELRESIASALARGEARQREESERKSLQEKLRSSNEEVQSLVLRGVHSLVEAVEAKDAYTRGHSKRVAKYACVLGSSYGGVDEGLLTLSGELHDVGKIGVPDAVLNKPGKLDAAELRMIRDHPAIGKRILEPLIRDEAVLTATLHHHERWDGGGYPAGLRGDEIPRNVQLLSIADTLDAMTSLRAYRPAHRWEEAVAEIEGEAGRQFAPAIVECFMANRTQLRSILDDSN